MTSSYRVGFGIAIGDTFPVNGIFLEFLGGITIDRCSKAVLRQRHNRLQRLRRRVR